MFHQALDFFDDLVVASTLIVLTSIIHAIGLDRIMAVITSRLYRADGNGFRPHVHKILLSVIAIFGTFLLITIHIWLWAFTYQILNIREFKTLEDAVYFSTVTFTTLGYGDIVLHDDWRVLSGIEAANGIILLGWSTAFLFEVMSMLYPRKRF